VFGSDGRFLHTVPAAHDQHNTTIDRISAVVQSADGNIIVKDLSFSNEGLFVKNVKPPEVGADEFWLPRSICAGPQGELLTWERRDNVTKLCMRDADCGLLWSVEAPELQDYEIGMDHKGRLLCLDLNNNVWIWEVDFD
jgi:hypothetical protein